MHPVKFTVKTFINIDIMYEFGNEDRNGRLGFDVWTLKEDVDKKTKPLISSIVTQA